MRIKGQHSRPLRMRSAKYTMELLGRGDFTGWRRGCAIYTQERTERGGFNIDMNSSNGFFLIGTWKRKILSTWLAWSLTKHDCLVEMLSGRLIFRRRVNIISIWKKNQTSLRSFLEIVDKIPILIVFYCYSSAWSAVAKDLHFRTLLCWWTSKKCDLISVRSMLYSVNIYRNSKLNSGMSYADVNLRWRKGGSRQAAHLCHISSQIIHTR